MTSSLLISILLLILRILQNTSTEDHKVVFFEGYLPTVLLCKTSKLRKYCWGNTEKKCYKPYNCKRRLTCLSWIWGILFKLISWRNLARATVEKSRSDSHLIRLPRLRFFKTAAVISMKEMAAIFNRYASVYDLLKKDNKERKGRKKGLKK